MHVIPKNKIYKENGNDKPCNKGSICTQLVWEEVTT